MNIDEARKLTKRARSQPPRNYIAYFSLCQEIGGRLEEAGKSIAVAGIHAPVFHDQIIAELRSLKGFCGRAIEAANAAQAAWSDA